MTSIREIVAEHRINHVDFLKIDVEGLELDVLKGVPWEDDKPSVILAEFEDSKTLQHGYSWEDLADFLLERDYTVFVSEWHPIVRYGIPHDWRAIRRYPCPLYDQDGWGNLLAFADDPGDRAISAAILPQIEAQQNKGQATSSKTDCQESPSSESLRSIDVGSLQPEVAPVRFVKWAWRLLQRHWHWVFLAFLVQSVLLISASLLSKGVWKLALWCGSGLWAALLVGIGVVGVGVKLWRSVWLRLDIRLKSTEQCFEQQVAASATSLGDRIDYLEEKLTEDRL